MKPFIDYMYQHDEILAIFIIFSFIGISYVLLSIIQLIIDIFKKEDDDYDI